MLEVKKYRLQIMMLLNSMRLEHLKFKMGVKPRLPAMKIEVQSKHDPENL